MKYITARNGKCVFSRRRVHCNHDDIEGKGHEDHGGLDENENQTCQIKNASGTTE